MGLPAKEQSGKYIVDILVTAGKGINKPMNYERIKNLDCKDLQEAPKSTSNKIGRRKHEYHEPQIINTYILHI